MSEAALETLLRRDRVVVGTALAVLIVAAWLYLLHLGSAMSNMAMPDMLTMPGMAMAMPAMHAWSWVEVGALVIIAVMMVAMMTPAAAPMILMFATIHRRRTAEGRPATPTAIFVLGYLVVWTIYSVVAALGQAGLQGRLFQNAFLKPIEPGFEPQRGPSGHPAGSAAPEANDRPAQQTGPPASTQGP